MVSIRRLLIVDPHPSTRKARAEALTSRLGLDVVSSGTATGAFEQMRRAPIQAVLVDQHLPDMDGRDFCRALRSDDPIVPILILGLNSSEAETLRALEAGATDYLARSCSVDLLAAKLSGH